jgi:hypothetical protein
MKDGDARQSNATEEITRSSVPDVTALPIFRQLVEASRPVLDTLQQYENQNDGRSLLPDESNA